MNFDKWFKKQSVVLQVILLLIPFLNWIVEILVRVSAVIRKQSTNNIVGLILYIVLGWVLGFVDLVLVALGHDFFLLD